MYVSRVSDQRGSIVALVAFSMPVIILFLALVVDIGNWKEHDRQLQNRADSAALAAGVEYVRQLQACVTTPVATGDAIRDIAKRYAGTADTTITGEKFNVAVNNQANLSIVINATDYTAADYSDGGGPCADHTTADDVSTGGLWTDVKARETNVRTLFGSLGFDLDQALARARVEVKPIVGITKRGLPFIAETGDNLECVWAQFVGARSGNASDVTLLGGTPNPVTLTPASWRTDESGIGPWTADVGGIDVTSSTNDIAVRYWFGSNTNGACNFSTPNKGLVPEDAIEGVDWINLYNNSGTPGANQAPMLREFRTSPGSCGGPGFVYPTDTTPSLSCTINVNAIVVRGANTAPTIIRVSSSDPDVGSVDLSSSDGINWSGAVSYSPNEVLGTNPSQNYVEVGQKLMVVNWRKSTGQIGGQNCAVTECTGTFPGETISGTTNVQHSTYIADPIASNPMTYAELLDSTGTSALDNSWPAESGAGWDIPAFKVRINQLGLDQTNSVLVRGSVQGTGNRTLTIDCTGANGGGANELRDSIINGCGNKYIANVRNDVCTPQPVPGTVDRWDCVSSEPGNKTAVRTGFETRFNCATMPNNWNPATSPGNLSSQDKRYAYIFLTSYGRTVGAQPNDQIPVRAFLRVYVTGWDIQPNGYETCGGTNEPPPRGYDGNGAQLWGHYVDVITIDDDVLTGNGECDLTVTNIQCKPVLVR